MSGIAKAYRKYAIDNGIHKSLKDKIKQNPILANMVGGRMLSYFQASPGLKNNQAEDYWYTTESIGRRSKNLTVDFTHNDVIKSVNFAKTIGFKKGQ